jgi:hypothetical protein
MPQDQTVPTGPQGENSKPTPTPPPPTPTPAEQNPKPGELDLGKILLPKKPIVAGKTADSAMRVNAGVLLEQEKTAELPKPAPATTPVQPPAPKDDSVVKALETYQSDIESVVRGKNTSLVSIAAAEAQRRSAQPIEASQETKKENKSGPVITNTLMIIGGVILLLGAAAAVVFVTRPAPTVQIALEAPTPFINVDETKAFTVPTSLFQHSAAISALQTQRENTALSLGMISRLYLALPATSTNAAIVPLNSHQLLGILGPHIPDALLRTINQNNYLFAFHSYNGNQPLLILQTDSYEQAFSGMLQWEPSMSQDLFPFFMYTPPVHISTDGVASTSPTSTPEIIQTGFVDHIIDNHDVRVIENSAKDILMVWGFLDRNTLVITTNEATLKEIFSRFTNSSIVPIP